MRVLAGILAGNWPIESPGSTQVTPWPTCLVVCLVLGFLGT
jgi:hypothetical protein